MRKLLIGACVAAAFAAPVSGQEGSTDPASAGLSNVSSAVASLDDEQASDEPEAAEEAAPAGGEQGVADLPPAASVAPPADSAALRTQLDRTAAHGRQLFAVARAGLLATQDMLSRVSDPEGAGITGWVAEPEGNAMAVTFYADGATGPVAVYRARILSGRAVSRDTYLTGERPLLSGLALRLALARSASESEEQSSCTRQPFNVVAVPPEGPDGPIRVYRISPPESRNRLPMGGHFLSTVTSDGTVSDSRAFSRGCLNVEVGDVPQGSQPGPIAVTHLLDPLPTEMHVFLSLFSGRPLVIAAGDPTRLFMVAGDSIREMRR